MSRPRSVTHLADTRGGEIVRLDSGYYRVDNLGLSRVSSRGVERRCRLLRDDLTETRDVLYLPPTTPVRELLEAP